MRRLALALVVLSVTCAWPRAALADAAPATSVDAQAHADRGVALVAANDFVAAAVELEEAERGFALAARAPDGSVRDADAEERRRRAVAAAAAAWARADLPVEALAAYGRLRATSAAQLSPEALAELDATMAALERRLGRVRVTGVPAGATVRLDGRVAAAAIGERDVPLGAGKHTLEVVVPGERSFSAPFEVAPGATVVVPVVLVHAAKSAHVRIDSNVATAEVQLDDRSPGTPPARFDVPPGTHRYRVTAAAYVTEEGSVEARAGETTLVRVHLAAAHPPLGVRIEPFVGVHAVNRDDSPLGSAAAAVGVRLFHRSLRLGGVAFGLDAEVRARELDRYGIGPVADWCPDRLASARLRWCPLALAALATAGGAEGAFESGHLGLRASTALELDLGTLFVRLAAGVAFERYRRNDSRDLTGSVTLGELSLGMDL